MQIAMIFDHLSKLRFYSSVVNPDHLRQVEHFLAQHKPLSLPLGVQEIDGKDVFVNVIEGSGKTKKGAMLERHNYYLDIHLTVQGEDLIGWKAKKDCAESQGYNSENEVELYDDAPSVWFPVPTDTFMILFSQDAHAPMAFSSKDSIKKLVFKLRV